MNRAVEAAAASKLKMLNIWQKVQHRGRRAPKTPHLQVGGDALGGGGAEDVLVVAQHAAEGAARLAQLNAQQRLAHRRVRRVDIQPLRLDRQALCLILVQQPAGPVEAWPAPYTKSCTNSWQPLCLFRT